MQEVLHFGLENQLVISNKSPPFHLLTKMSTIYQNNPRFLADNFQEKLIGIRLLECTMLVTNKNHSFQTHP